MRLVRWVRAVSIVVGQSIIKILVLQMIDLQCLLSTDADDVMQASTRRSNETMLGKSHNERLRDADADAKTSCARMVAGLSRSCCFSHLASPALHHCAADAELDLAC